MYLDLTLGQNNIIYMAVLTSKFCLLIGYWSRLYGPCILIAQNNLHSFCQKKYSLKILSFHVVTYNVALLSRKL